MITLYQFQWSHYVEKVRWALDFKGLNWQAVEVVAFIKGRVLLLFCLGRCRCITVPTPRQIPTRALLKAPVSGWNRTE